MDRKLLNKEIHKLFDIAELKVLCHELEIEYEDLQGETKSAKVLELVKHCKRHGQTEELVEYCKTERPNGNWNTSNIVCALCGRETKFQKTFTCNTCSRPRICIESCFDIDQKQCVECSSSITENIIGLTNPEAPFRVRIWTEHSTHQDSNRNIVVVPKRVFGQYKLGDSVTVYFQSDADAYIYMINIGPIGDSSIIYPNRFSSNNYVIGGKQYTFPREEASFVWTLQEPIGTEIIKVIATKVPVDIEQFLAEVSPKTTERDIVTGIKTNEWAEAYCVLLVRN